MNEERSAGKPSREDMLYRVDCQIQMAESVIDEKVDKDLMLIMVRSLKIWKAIRTLIEHSGKSGKPDTEPQECCADCGKWMRRIDAVILCGDCSPKPDTEGEKPDRQGEVFCELCGTMTMERHGCDVYYCESCGATIKVQSHKAERPSVSRKWVRATVSYLKCSINELAAEDMLILQLTEAGVEVA